MMADDTKQTAVLFDKSFQTVVPPNPNDNGVVDDNDIDEEEEEEGDDDGDDDDDKEEEEENVTGTVGATASVEVRDNC